MLLWPLQTHTSPIITSSKTVFSLMAMVKGPPADGVLIFRLHLAPEVPVVTYLVVSQETLTLIFSEGAHHPHKLTWLFCCSTIWLPRIEGSRTSAVAPS